MQSKYPVFVVFVVFVIGIAICGDARRPLHKFVQHYEPLYYDHSHLMRHHHRVRRSNMGPKQLDLSFTAFDRQFNVILKPDDSYFQKDFRVLTDGEERSRSNAMMYSYAGHLADDPSSRVIGHLAYGVFDGYIKTAGETYYVEPSSRYFNSSDAESHSLIYRHSDIDMEGTYGTTCGATTRAQQRRLAMEQRSVTSDTFDASERPKRLHKRQNRDPNRVLCPLNVIGDYKFFEAVTTGGDEEIRIAQAMNLLRNFVTMGSDNFENTDFDDDGVDDGIQFGIFELSVNSTAPDSSSPYANNFIGVESFLTTHSANDWEAFCLSYLFTYRDFDNGVLGLAYVAGLNSRGGICDGHSQGRTLNTGIVTLLNYGNRVPTAVTGLTFTHEAGHNFGSEHDPDTNPTCAPSGSAGRYVMFAHATDGSRDNNNRFSPCSIDMMFPIIEARGQDRNDGCFVESTDLCGNGLVDEGEKCDCGRAFDTTTSLCNDDRCCNGSSCRLANGVFCSPQEGPCCNETCMYQAMDFPCREASDCAFNQTCNGSSASCPTSDPRMPSGNDTVIPCNDGSNFCVNGECTGSICVPLLLDDCECEEEELQCHVCCRIDNRTCVSTIRLAQENATARELLPGNQGEVLQVGFPCNNFMGYCDFFNMCRLADGQGALTRLTNAILNSEELQQIISIINNYWWALIVGVVVALIASFILVLVCHCVLPRPEHMKKRAERRKSIRNSRRHRGGYDNYHGQEMQYHGGHY